MPRPDEFVTIVRTHDPVRAEVIRDVLAQEGIPATIPGTHHNALLGAAGGLIEIRVQVPAREAERATGIVAAMDDEDQVLVDESEEARELGRVVHEESFTGPGEGPYRSGPRRKRAEQPRMKRVAAFLSLAVTFGTGHLYARETASGVVLFVTQLVTFFVGLSHPVLMWAIPMLALVDFVGSLRAVDRTNARRPLGARAQLARTSALAGGALLVSAFAVPFVVEALRPEPEEREPFHDSHVVQDLDPADIFRQRPGR